MGRPRLGALTRDAKVGDIRRINLVSVNVRHLCVFSVAMGSEIVVRHGEIGVRELMHEALSSFSYTFVVFRCRSSDE